MYKNVDNKIKTKLKKIFYQLIEHLSGREKILIVQFVFLLIYVRKGPNNHIFKW